MNVMEIEIKMLSVEEYLIKVRQYSKNTIILKKLIHGKSNNDTINFMSYKDNDEKRVIHSKSDNIEFIIDDNADEVI